MGRGPGPQGFTNLPFVPFDHQIRTATGTLDPGAGTPAFITANVGLLPINGGTTNLNPTQFTAGASDAKKFYAPQDQVFFKPTYPGGALRTAQLSAGLTSFGIMVVDDLLDPRKFVVQGGGAGSPTSFTFTTSEFFTDPDNPPQNLVINDVQYAGWKYVGKNETAQTITVSNFLQPDDSISIGTAGVPTLPASRTFYLWIEGTGNTNTDQLKISRIQPDPAARTNMRLSLGSDVVSADENGAPESDPTIINSGVPINVSQFRTNQLTTDGLLPELGTDNVTELLGDPTLFFEIDLDRGEPVTSFGRPVAEYSGNFIDSLSAIINFRNFSRSIFTTYENRDIDNTGVVTNTYLIGQDGDMGPSVPSNLLVNGQLVEGYPILLIQTIGSTVVISTGILVQGRQSGLTKNFLQITEVNQFVQADGNVAPVQITVSTEFASARFSNAGAVVGYRIE